jgi:hypothetical protein
MNSWLGMRMYSLVVSMLDSLVGSMSDKLGLELKYIKLGLELKYNMALELKYKLGLEHKYILGLELV